MRSGSAAERGPGAGDIQWVDSPTRHCPGKFLQSDGAESLRCRGFPKRRLGADEEFSRGAAGLAGDAIAPDHSTSAGCGWEQTPALGAGDGEELVSGSPCLD